MDFGPVGALDYMAVCDDAINIDEEAAAAGKFFAARVEGFDCDGGGLDTTDEFGKLILCVTC
jgi:hypothetical protein